jgi:hypothetical protein
MKTQWFEFGGARFKDREGLLEILGKGYFREGDAWGSVRQGWAVAISSHEAFEILSACVGGRLIAYSSAGWGERALLRAPASVRAGNLEMSGTRMWFAMVEGGFSLAAERLWARCEAHLIGESAKGGAKGKRGSPRGSLRI